MGSIQLPVHSYNLPGRSPSRLVNCYAQQTIGKQPVELLGAPGVVPWCDLGGGGRGLYVMRGILYGVAGTTLYKIDATGSQTPLGTLPGTGKLMFAGNGTEIMFSNRYLFSSGTVTEITDPDLPAISAIDMVDNYFVYSVDGSNQWGCSDLYSGAVYNALDFASSDLYPDDLVTVIADHRQALLFGQETMEPWWNSGNNGSGFPFERVAGAFIELGALARHGVCKQDNTVWWLANDKTIRSLRGQAPLRVSQHGVEEAIARYARVDDCEAWSYTWGGHLFVVFNFPSATASGGATWTFDITTNEWHERATYGSTSWDMRDSVSCYGKVFVQQASSGDIGYLSDDNYSEFGGTLRREWTYPQVYDTNRMVTHSQLDLVCANDTPNGLVPYVNMEYSNDGGRTWNLLPQREFGRTGAYDHVVRWNVLGQARDRVYRGSLDDAAVPLRLTDTVLRAE